MSKKTLSQLKTKTTVITLTHPDHGELDAWLELRSVKCNDYIFMISELQRKERIRESEESEQPLKEIVYDNATLLATLVTNWDEDFFEMEYNTENVVKVLADLENFWIRDAIDEAQKDDTLFLNKS